MPPPHLFAKGLYKTSRRKDTVCRPQNEKSCTALSSTSTATHAMAAIWENVNRRVQSGDVGPENISFHPRKNVV